MTIFVFYNFLLNRDDPILFQLPKLFMELEVPIVKPQ